MEKFAGHPFHQVLKQRGLKSTRQRDEIVQVFLEAGSHLSVEELYQRVRQRNPRIGQATVYRTLKLMAESGWASARKFRDGMARFEHRTEGDHHDHLICLACGKIVEFESQPIEALQSRIARKQGFKIFDHKMELYGRCAECTSKKAGPAAGSKERSGHE